MCAVRDLEALIERAVNLSPEDRQHELIEKLNKLELACLALPNVEPDTDDDAQSPNTHMDRRRTLGAAFPELGVYHKVRPSPPEDAEEIGFGDAANDLADILRDADDALWVERCQSLPNAVWQARFNYEHHFGSHLADLRSYLYRLRFFGP